MLEVQRSEEPLYHRDTDHSSLMERLLSDFDDDIYEGRRELLALRGADARNILDETQKLLDLQYNGNQFIPHDMIRTRQRLYANMLDLAESCQQLPPSLFISAHELCADIPICGGSNSDIFLGQYQSTLVAVRKIRSHQLLSGPRDKTMARLFRACLKWRQFRHPNIVPLFGIDVNTFSHSPCLIQPWYANGHIRDYISKMPSKPSPEQINRWLTDIASGMTYLHEWGICHGDLRGSNVLIDDVGTAKVSDVMLTPFREEWTIATKPWNKVQRWLAPELIVSTHPTFAGDIYAFGCMTIELYTGDVPPYPAIMQLHPDIKITDGDIPPRPQTMPDGIWNLANACWHLDPRDRVSMHRIFQVLSSDPQCTSSPADIVTIANAASKSRRRLSNIYFDVVW